jgi:histidinol-phosphate aminotransferase
MKTVRDKSVTRRARAKGVERLLRRDLCSFKPYQPIELPGTRPGDTVPSGGPVKLDGNENVYGCSPRVRKALAAFDQQHIYPDPDQRELTQALAGYTGLAPEHILPTAGSDEMIDLITRAFLEPGDGIINCIPTFGMYAFSAQVAGGRCIEVKRTAEYQVNVPAVRRAIKPRTKVIFIASPNNPTGTVTPRDAILELLRPSAEGLRTGILVVVDEAYCEFSGETVADLVPEHENLVVLRTFSKWAGLAGLRVGYGLMTPALRDRFMQIKTPYTVSGAAQVAALESLRDVDYLRKTVALLVRERDRMAALLAGLEWLEPAPSRANFVLCRVHGYDARALQDGLRRRGIYVRYFDTPLLKNAIRISAGKPEHTDALIAALKSWKA